MPIPDHLSLFIDPRCSALVFIRFKVEWLDMIRVFIAPICIDGSDEKAVVLLGAGAESFVILPVVLLAKAEPTGDHNRLIGEHRMIRGRDTANRGPRMQTAS
jgi:hypothetical protein